MTDERSASASGRDGPEFGPPAVDVDAEQRSTATTTTGERIVAVHATPTTAGFFFDDQRAIVEGAPADGFAYDAEPVTPGFDRIREPGRALSVDIELEDGTVVTGDCAAVQYAAAGGRDPLFDPTAHRAIVEGPVADALVGRPAGAFADNAAVVETLTSDDDAERLHSAVRYGVSQALLAAAARSRRTTRTRVLADALDLTPATVPVPVFGQSGAERRRGAERMLIKGADVLPHGLFNSIETIGADGDRLREYLAWLSDRADALAAHHPRFHVDVYGLFGQVFGPPYDRPAVIEYVRELERAAAPYSLQIEEPMNAGDRAGQLHAMAELHEALAEADIDVDLVADEWCDTLADVKAFVDAGAADLVQVKTPDLGGLQRSARAVRYCRDTPVRAYLGGTCNETDLSARACAHVALATDAAQVLAKPGMGFDEGYMIVTNEMRRTLARHDRGDARRRDGPAPERTGTEADGDGDRTR